MALRLLLLRRGVRGTDAILPGGFSPSHLSCLTTTRIINNNNNNEKKISCIFNNKIFFNPRDSYCTSIPPHPPHNCPDILPACPFANYTYKLKDLDDVLSCAKFAVKLHNAGKDAKLQFQRILNAGREPAAGAKVFVMLEATDADDNIGSYLAIVYWQPWTDSKEVIYFGPVTW